MEENISLKNLTTMKVGGSARFFISVQDEKGLVRALNFATENQLPVFVLGGGSNIVVSDKGFDGLVIKNEIPGISFGVTEDVVRVKAGAGVSWDDLVKETVEWGLYGLENLSLIPGTVGAAPVQNIGAYGAELKDCLLTVRAFDLKTREFRIFSNSECDFSYRDSHFKQNRNFIITSIELSLSRSGELNLSYKDLAREVQDGEVEIKMLTPSDVRRMVIDIRKRKLPDPDLIPTAGSFFKNPEVTKEHFSLLKNRFPDMPGFELGFNKVKIPLAWIIENVAQLKGVDFGGAAVYEKHALVLVNNKDATASDIYNLSEKVRRSVFDLTNINIETEVQFIGDF